MDELLASRVKQLREIEDRLSALLVFRPDWDKAFATKAITALRNDIADMIRVAEAEHDAF